MSAHLASIYEECIFPIPFSTNMSSILGNNQFSMGGYIHFYHVLNQYVLIMFGQGSTRDQIVFTVFPSVGHIPIGQIPQLPKQEYLTSLRVRHSC